MAKKAAAKPKKTSQKKHSKLYNFTYKHTALVVVGVLAILVLGYFGMRQYQISQEKKQFAQAELVLADLSKAIQQELGEPISSETSKSCGYSSAKFSKGTLRCGVGFDLTYENIGIEDLKNKQTAFINIIENTSSLVMSGTDFGNFEIAQFSSKNKQTSAGFKIQNSSLDCTESIMIEADDPLLKIGASCTKKSIDEYFPLRD